MINKKNLVIVLIILVVAGYLLYPSSTVSDKVEVKIASLSFNSSEDDNSVMAVEYILGISNTSNESESFKVVISPKELDWYPYLHCIPAKYESEIIFLEAGQGEMFKLTTNYKSTEIKSTSGHLSDQDLNIEIIGVN